MARAEGENKERKTFKGKTLKKLALRCRYN